MPRGNPAAQNTLLEDRSFSPDPERVVASEPEDLSVPSRRSPTAPSVEDTDTGDGTEAAYHPFNEHFSHHNGGSTDKSQPDGDVADKCYSPIYGENRIFNRDWGILAPPMVRYDADSIM